MGWSVKSDILLILPTHGHGGCEYNALSAIKYFRDKHGIDVLVALPMVPETEYVVELCNANDLPISILDCEFSSNDNAESVKLQRYATWEMIDRSSPSAVFVPMPWPKRGQGVIAGCADTGIPTVVKFALVPPVAEPTDYVMPEARSALGRRQVWFANSRFSADLIEKHWKLPARSVDSFHVGPIGLAHLVAQSHMAAAETNDLRASLRAELSLPSDCRIAATVARLSAQKGYDTLMAAAPAILRSDPSLVMLWIGHGEWQATIQEWIAASSFEDRIKLAGFRSDVRRLLKGSDIFVLPTRYEGGCSQALLEAMEEGLPIVVTNTSAVGEVTRHEHNGLLVPIGDATALVDAVGRLAQDPELSRQLGENAKHDAVAFSAERSFEHTLLRIRRAMASAGIAKRLSTKAGEEPQPSVLLPKLRESRQIQIPASHPGYSDGWYEVETAPNDGRFRWMARDGVIAVGLAVDGPSRIEIEGYSALTRSALDKIEVYVDGQRAAPVGAWNEERCHEWTLQWEISPDRSPKRPSIIRIECDGATRPCDLDSSLTDTRRLSIAVSKIKLRSLV